MESTKEAMLVIFHRRVRLTFVAESVRVFGFMFLLAFAVMTCGIVAKAQEIDVAKKLQGFDAYMEQTLKDWNTPGVGVGIVVNDKLVFAKGYGYRDYEKKLPYTPKTLPRLRRTPNYLRRLRRGCWWRRGS